MNLKLQMQHMQHERRSYVQWRLTFVRGMVLQLLVEVVVVIQKHFQLWVLMQQQLQQLELLPRECWSVGPVMERGLLLVGID
jgi:hypothetical protein